MKTFYLRRRHDYNDAFINALTAAGYIPEPDPELADFLLMEYEPLDQELRDELLGRFWSKPRFIIPHTPYSYWLWDGIIAPSPVCCNFVVAPGAVAGMAAYGYPYRVEAVGFYRCDVQPFKPTRGRKLLFAPAHPLKVDKQYPRQVDGDLHQLAREWVLAHHNNFDETRVRYAYDFESNGLQAFKNRERVKFEPIFSWLNSDLMRSIAAADVVISCDTVGYMSAAMGKPTVFYGHRGTLPGGRNGDVAHFEKYRDHYEFPRLLEDMIPYDVMKLCQAPDPQIEKWKLDNIGQSSQQGGSFDAEKFISVIREYV